ncbi:MAG: hypothetical protein QXZ38_04085 [Candidatus Micrarchaeaceae archaeon]
MEKVKIEKIGYKCLRCGYEWIPKKENPKNCPRCHSPYWFKERRRHKINKYK